MYDGCNWPMWVQVLATILAAIVCLLGAGFADAVH
jgi:hypothetical protein